MKKLLLVAAIPLAGLFTVPAAAQSPSGLNLGAITGYGALGYSHSDRGRSDLGAVTGRLGLRFGPFLGAEAEGSFGVTDDHSLRSGPPTTTKWNRSVAAYAVGYAPVTPRFDLFARVGLGNTKIETTGLVQSLVNRRDSLNYGAGGQYFLTAKDGLRLDWTHESLLDGPGDANTYSIAYVRRF